MLNSNRLAAVTPAATRAVIAVAVSDTPATDENASRIVTPAPVAAVMTETEPGTTVRPPEVPAMPPVFTIAPVATLMPPAVISIPLLAVVAPVVATCDRKRNA